MIKRISKLSAVVLAVCAATAGGANAHTISLGSYNAGAPGSVTLVMGTYDHGSGFAQGAMTLIASTTTLPAVTFQNFTDYLTTKPALLVDGDNNFYGDVGTAYGSGPSDSYHSAVNNLGLGPVVDWQAVTFTGLAAGTYTYQLSGMTSANWTNINSFENNWTGTIVISESTVTGVPEPTTLALVGLAITGLALSRRRATV